MSPSRSGKVTGTRERLAGISQYFLSEPDSNPVDEHAPVPDTHLLPVLVDSELTQVFVYALARALHTHGLTALVLHVESSLRSADPRSSSLSSHLDSPAALRRHLHEEISGSKRPPRICLIPVTDSRDPHLREYEHTLIAVGASLPALKRCYLNVKHLSVAGVPTRIGAIIVGASSDENARRYFDRLAAAAMRFLGHPVTYIGAVITSEPTAEPADKPGSVSTNSLKGVVDALIKEGFLGRNPGPHPAGTPDTSKNPSARIR